MVFESPMDNAVYVQGYLKGVKADGLDWAKARMALIELEEDMRNRLAKKDEQIKRVAFEKELEISRLKSELSEKEDQIINLESQIEMYKVAWKHRND